MADPPAPHSLHWAIQSELASSILCHPVKPNANKGYIFSSQWELKPANGNVQHHKPRWIYEMGHRIFHGTDERKKDLLLAFTESVMDFIHVPSSFSEIC